EPDGASALSTSRPSPTAISLALLLLPCPRMTTANDLGWRDLEWDASEDSGVRQRDDHAPFPLVHRAPEYDDELDTHAFFSSPPPVPDAFDDLVDPLV